MEIWTETREDTPNREGEDIHDQNARFLWKEMNKADAKTHVKAYPLARIPWPVKLEHLPGLSPSLSVFA